MEQNSPEKGANNIHDMTDSAPLHHSADKSRDERAGGGYLDKRECNEIHELNILLQSLSKSA